MLVCVIPFFFKDCISLVKLNSLWESFTWGSEMHRPYSRKVKPLNHEQIKCVELVRHRLTSSPRRSYKGKVLKMSFDRLHLLNDTYSYFIRMQEKENYCHLVEVRGTAEETGFYTKKSHLQSSQTATRQFYSLCMIQNSLHLITVYVLVVPSQRAFNFFCWAASWYIFTSHMLLILAGLRPRPALRHEPRIISAEENSIECRSA